MCSLLLLTLASTTFISALIWEGAGEGGGGRMLKFLMFILELRKARVRTLHAPAVLSMPGCSCLMVFVREDKRKLYVLIRKKFSNNLQLGFYVMVCSCMLRAFSCAGSLGIRFFSTDEGINFCLRNH